MAGKGGKYTIVLCLSYDMEPERIKFFQRLEKRFERKRGKHGAFRYLCDIVKAMEENK
jgi:hypothetical protein